MQLEASGHIESDCFRSTIPLVQNADLRKRTVAKSSRPVHPKIDEDTDRYISFCDCPFGGYYDPVRDVKRVELGAEEPATLETGGTMTAANGPFSLRGSGLCNLPHQD